MNQMMFDICILGSANSDLFLEVQDFPKEGETIAAKKSYIKNGGKGANQAVASSLLGSKSIFAGIQFLKSLGQIGNDELGQILVKEMKASGLSLDSLRYVDVQTGQAIILLNHALENSIIIVAGANTHYQDLNELPQKFQDALQNSNFLQLQMEIPQEINYLAAKHMKEHDKITMLDCGGKAEALKHQFLDNLTFISPNETELERLINEKIVYDGEVDKALEDIVHKKVFDQFTKLIVLLKLGSNGSLLITKEFSVRSYTVTHYNPKILNDYKIVDTVGAGDCFTSAFCSQFYRLLSEIGEVRESTLRNLDNDKQKQIFQKSMEFASAAAFLCITQHGAMPSMPKLDEVNEFLKKYL
ncbi:hypothetical protein pb186bvf_012424 [Paramecium bursaria]